jgi:hypothetical protein
MIENQTVNFKGCSSQKVTRRHSSHTFEVHELSRHAGHGVSPRQNVNGYTEAQQLSSSSSYKYIYIYI